VRFDEQGDVSKSLFVLTIQKQQIQLWNASTKPEG
jgi:hypothetical protein